MSNADRRARKRENKQVAQQQRYAQWAAARRKHRARKVAPIVLVVILGGVGLALLLGGDEPDSSADDTTTTTIERIEPEWDGAACPSKEAFEGDKALYTSKPDTKIGETDTFRATIKTSEGTMVAELDAASDLVTVNNFVFLACEGFYDQSAFHRVIDGFMIQGGSADGKGLGDAGYRFRGGTPDDGYKVGDIVMANSGDASSNGAQFFIVTGPQGEALPGNYTRFGKLVEGIDVAKAIAALQDTTKQDPLNDGPPKREIVIENVTVEKA